MLQGNICLTLLPKNAHGITQGPTLIVGYTVGNLVLRRRVSGAVKRDFRTYIRRYTSPNENFEYGYPHSNAPLTFSLQKDGENVLVVPLRPATQAA